ncbi:MAG: hypothetical protein ACLQVD_11490 [Capsulimonadaceae bacterium]
MSFLRVRVIGSIAVCFAVVAALPVPASAKPATVTTHEATGTPKAAIKVGRDAANTGKIKHKDVKSGRGGYGSILHVDNHTRLYVDIYVDGDYDGTVEPYGDLYLSEDPGDHGVVGEAPGTSYYFEDDSMYTPGTWSLYP